MINQIHKTTQSWDIKGTESIPKRFVKLASISFASPLFTVIASIEIVALAIISALLTGVHLTMQIFNNHSANRARSSVNHSIAQTLSTLGSNATRIPFNFFNLFRSKSARTSQKPLTTFEKIKSFSLKHKYTIAAGVVGGVALYWLMQSSLSSGFSPQKDSTPSIASCKALNIRPKTVKEAEAILKCDPDFRGYDCSDVGLHDGVHVSYTQLEHYLKHAFRADPRHIQHAFRAELVIKKSCTNSPLKQLDCLFSKVFSPDSARKYEQCAQKAHRILYPFSEKDSESTTALFGKVLTHFKTKPYFGGRRLFRLEENIKAASDYLRSEAALS